VAVADLSTSTPTRPAQDWRILVAVFWVTSMVEGLGVSQIFALLPTYLREMGVAASDRLAFIGLFSALIFVVGMPLVPLWGAWADKYSRKVVIVRSALVEAVVFAGVALAREPWQVALAMLLIGFQLGNTGIMLAGIRDVTVPLLKPIFVILTSLSIIWDFQVFNQIWLLLSSQPPPQYFTMSIYAFTTSFQQSEYGLGAAIALVMVAILLVVSFVYIRQMVKIGETE